MYYIVVYCLQYRINQFLTQQFTFAVNIDITSSTEINPFERTSLLFFRLIDLSQTHFSLFVYQNSLSGQ